MSDLYFLWGGWPRSSLWVTLWVPAAATICPTMPLHNALLSCSVSPVCSKFKHTLRLATILKNLLPHLAHCLWEGAKTFLNFLNFSHFLLRLGSSILTSKMCSYQYYGCPFIRFFNANLFDGISWKLNFASRFTALDSVVEFTTPSSCFRAGRKRPKRWSKELSSKETFFLYFSILICFFYTYVKYASS